MIISWLSFVCAISFASALPVSVVPVRPYVFLAPELPKFTLQPTVKVQAPASIQPVSAVKSESVANRQYVLVYPSYQYVTTRQDESSNSGFFESIQNYFINFGQNGQSDESSQIMDAVDPDKSQSIQSIPSIQSAPPAQSNELIQSSQLTTKSVIPSDVAPEKIPNKQKFVYSYITPASTVPLNADRRLFYLAEQPQIFGSFSGSAVNPVFNIQPVPVVLSRSNVAQPDETQPNKVISENVQKFSQIPPVMATVEQVSQVQSKSNVAEHVDAHARSGAVEQHDTVHHDSVHHDSVHHDTVHAIPANARSDVAVHPDSVHQVPVHHAVVHPDPVHHSPEHSVHVKSGEHHDIGHQSLVHHEPVHVDAGHHGSVHADSAHAKSNVVHHINSIVVDPLPESKVAPVPHVGVPVEDNRAVPVPTEPTDVVGARSNANPLTVSNEAVSSVVASPVVHGNVDGNESVQPGVVVASLKEVQPVVPVGNVNAVASGVQAVVDQNVQLSEHVEAVTGSV